MYTSTVPISIFQSCNAIFELKKKTWYLNLLRPRYSSKQNRYSNRYALLRGEIHFNVSAIVNDCGLQRIKLEWCQVLVAIC